MDNPLGVELFDPWILIGDDASVFESELKLEMTPGHQLYDEPVKAVARRVDNDDVLFAIECEAHVTQFAVVHLTWRCGPESTSDFPCFELYRSLADWVQNGMIPDQEENFGSSG